MRLQIPEPAGQRHRFRLLGGLPLFFFLARVVEYAVVSETPEQILWCCHISNLLLAIGMFLANAWLIRIAVFWLILGLPPWVLDMVVTRLVTPVSIVSHLGGFILAIVALRQVGAMSGSWFPSLVYFLILQQISRLATEPTPYTNVNVAHFAYGPWKDSFATYGQYWVANTAAATMMLVVIERVLLRLFPRSTA
jgi:hypothetical protein